MSSKRVRALVLGSAMVLAGSCNRPNGGASTGEGNGEPGTSHRRFGDLMAEVGRRFERSGRAVLADRWELAAYDVGEINEVFDNDVPNAQMPEEVHVDLRPLARAFAAAHPPALNRAIASHDREAFMLAFSEAAATCNGCHLAAGKGFIEVPRVPGQPVPLTEPMAHATASAPAAVAVTDASAHP